MAKGYWIAHITVSDQTIYEKYRATNSKAFDKFGGKFLVRGGQHEVARGASRERHVIVEFPSYEAAKACYVSPEYSEAKDIFDQAAESDLVIIEGVA